MIQKPQQRYTDTTTLLCLITNITAGVTALPKLNLFLIPAQNRLKGFPIIILFCLVRHWCIVTIVKQKLFVEFREVKAREGWIVNKHPAHPERSAIIPAVHEMSKPKACIYCRTQILAIFWTNSQVKNKLLDDEIRGNKCK